jgi:hypothetical protein
MSTRSETPTKVIATRREIPGLPKNLEAELAPLAKEIRGRTEKAVKDISEIGQLLTDARTKLAKHGNGTFYRWIQSECRMAIKSAQRCIWVSSRFGSLGHCVLNFEPNALYRLSAPKCPWEAGNEAEKMAAKGERITSRVAAELIAAHSPPKPEAELTEDAAWGRIHQLLMSEWKKLSNGGRAGIVQRLKSEAVRLKNEIDN